MAEELLATSRKPYAVTITATTTAAPIGSSTEDLVEVMIQADPDNGSVDVLIGSPTVQCWKLEPGDVVNWPIRNPALIYAKTASGTAVVNLIGRGGA